MTDETLDSIKLVIWDLDDTFWSGTLAEETVQAIPRNIEIVKALLRRGIINSICSSNDHKTATELLKRLGVLSFFVFSQISWAPKGDMVSKIIADCQLRPDNVLFIDDNPRVRAEVEHANPGVSTVDPKLLPLFNIERWSVSDPEMTRLRQYEALEKKRAYRQLNPMLDSEFLRLSRIAVTIGRSLREEAHRLAELTNRAHQLNFTKQNLTTSALASLLASPDHDCWSIAVTDRFAEYGLSGFACINKRARELIHFVFSCRVLNMGIEQFVYAQLGRPVLRVIEPVSSDPLQGSKPDWIHIGSRPLTKRPANGFSKASGAGARASPATVFEHPMPSVFVKGSCDLLAVSDYLKSSPFIGKIDCEFDLRRKSGTVTVLHNHLAVLRLLNDAKTWNSERDVVKMFPWFDPSIEATALFSIPYDVYILSIARDLQAGLYRNKQTGLLLPFEDIGVCWTDVKSREAMLKLSRYRTEHGLNRKFLDWLSRHFEYAGEQDAAMISGNVQWLRSILPEQSTLLILDASEVLPEGSPFAETSYVRLAGEVNQALKAAAALLTRTSIIEVSKIAVSQDDLVRSPSHFARHVYHRIAGEILEKVKGLQIAGGQEPHRAS